ncbi:hypothetical protein D5086_006058 [Populus alba]|uniref:Uncharacterized protein n=3 Tax=Populus TaxID=3689 RepID=A0ACC4CKQ6_POPAL|nr:hypothetical protein NC653_008032 [Populus alba x Populus x berolinensis]TKR65721.1 hypothetical protein D5086_0000318520 [Populus alba]
MEAAGLRLRVSLKETNGSSVALIQASTIAVQERLSSWTSSLPFGDHGGKQQQQQQQQPDVGTSFDAQNLEEILMAEQTTHGSTTTDGITSLPAIVSMEQFSR